MKAKNAQIKLAEDNTDGRGWESSTQTAQLNFLEADIREKQLTLQYYSFVFHAFQSNAVILRIHRFV